MDYTPDSTGTSSVSASDHEFEDDEFDNDGIDGEYDNDKSDDESDTTQSNASYEENLRV